jgi:mannose-6-phosphate isomerase-like protein (cupin superfamily)
MSRNRVASRRCCVARSNGNGECASARRFDLPPVRRDIAAYTRARDRIASSGMAPARPRLPCSLSHAHDVGVFVSLPSLQPYIRQGDEHQRLDWMGGQELAVILDSAVTGGQLSVIEVHARRGDAASPIHVHGRDDEAFLLLDGAMTVWVGGQRRGSCHRMPSARPPKKTGSR